mgnify:CR=1 FL=1
MAATLGFYGGVGSVTGANFMLDTGRLAVLVDCGLIQGDRFAEAKNAEPFVYDPAAVDVLLVTHAHADHIGRIPKLVRDGFRGRIYSTPPTRALAAIMFDDALQIMRYEAERDGREPLYAQADIDQALAQWETKPYEATWELGDGVVAQFLNAGHILGSAMVELTRGARSIVFTGDVGNVPQPLMAAPTVPTGYDYLVMESVYGDRVHEEVAERTALLTKHIQDTIDRSGTLIIPAFSLERTQGILYAINNLVEAGTIPPIKTFLDSPLAIRVTDVYRHATAYLKPTIQEQIVAGDDIFAFEGLSFTETVQESKAIATFDNPKIIIAGSGMSHGGRIREHEKRLLGDTNTTLLLVGYQTVGSVGRVLQDGAKEVRIDGVPVRVRARIETIRGFSGHADRNQLMELVYHGTRAHQPERIFVTMGEERASLFLAQRLHDYLDLPARVPGEQDEVAIDF